jgi:hypothetical protein
MGFWGLLDACLRKSETCFLLSNCLLTRRTFFFCECDKVLAVDLLLLTSELVKSVPKALRCFGGCEGAMNCVCERVCMCDTSRLIFSLDAPFRCNWTSDAGFGDQL